MLRSKNLTRILSLLIAIVLWSYVMVIENPLTTQRISNIPVELLNVGSLSQNGFAVLEGGNKTVEVTVRGTRAEIAKYKDQITASVNLFGYGYGDHNLLAEVSPIGSLSIVEVRPARILVKVENLVSIYKPVELTFTGEFEPDTEPGKISLQPEHIEIKGPQSVVEAVSYVGVKLPADMLNRDGVSLTLNAFAFDENGETVHYVNLSSNTVNVGATLYDTKTAPLLVEIIGEISEEYELTSLVIPDSVTIRGGKSSLAAIDYVYAEPVDISEVAVTSELPVKVILPEGVEPAKKSYNLHVAISIKGISKADFTYTSQEILITGLSDGLYAYINTPALSVHIAGTEAVIEAAVKGDFLLSVDVSGLGQGGHLVPVIITHNKELHRLGVEPGEVHITINEEREV